MLLRFLGTILFVAFIFLLPNKMSLILITLGINQACMIIYKVNLYRVWTKIANFWPFILLTLVLNVLLDSIDAAIFLALKLFLATQATIIYTETISGTEFIAILKKLLKPLRMLGFDTGELELMITISWTMLPNVQKNVTNSLTALRAKAAPLNLSNITLLLKRQLHSLVKDMSEFDSALIAKGFGDIEK